MRIKFFTSSMTFTVPLQLISISFTTTGYTLLKTTLAVSYQQVRFASLSKQFELSQHIKLIQDFSTCFKTTLCIFLLAVVLLTSTQLIIEFGTFAYQFVFQLYLFVVSLIYLVNTSSVILFHKHLNPFKAKQKKGVKVMFNNKIMVENTVENNFNVLEQMWSGQTVQFTNDEVERQSVFAWVAHWLRFGKT
ncbi:unnamed protein product [Bursaphelenchus okinawaensis]|uniref:Uncharacterized protein n=1 Tax=Bursaphelenchus okinawaensis TaxID=465554 RepID=A0A811K2B9_9BILA|nr:unnamed protein product [Bursaphelenchus okinawaensis]CAG9089428.1 unnamed protein product [Bursaphelenchus okinawaensis]